MGTLQVLISCNCTITYPQTRLCISLECLPLLMAHSWPLVDAQCLDLGLSPVPCSLVGAVGWALAARPCPALWLCHQQVSSSHRFSPSLYVLVLLLMLSVREWDNYYIGDEALTWVCWPVLIFAWDNEMEIAVGRSPAVGQKLQKQIRNPGLSTLSGNGKTQREPDCCNCSMLPHTHSPEGHLLLGSRAAPGLCCSEFH